MVKLIFLILGLASGCVTTRTERVGNGPAGSDVRESIDLALQAKKSEFMACADRETVKPTGKIIVEWVINLSGQPENLKIAQSTFKNPALEHCLINTVKKIQFQYPAEDLPLTIQYPFNFSVE